MNAASQAHMYTHAGDDVEHSAEVVADPLQADVTSGQPALEKRSTSPKPQSSSRFGAKFSTWASSYKVNLKTHCCIEHANTHTHTHRGRETQTCTHSSTHAHAHYHLPHVTGADVTVAPKAPREECCLFGRPRCKITGVTTRCHPWP